MHRITIHLSAELKARLEQASQDEQRSEGDIILDSLTAALAGRTRPAPRIPLTPEARAGRSDAAERVDALLNEFGAT